MWGNVPNKIINILGCRSCKTLNKMVKGEFHGYVCSVCGVENWVSVPINLTSEKDFQKQFNEYLKNKQWK